MPDHSALEHGCDYSGQDLTGWQASEKYDGVRAYWDGHRLLSRSGIPCPAIPADVAAALPVGVPLDCELYAGPGDAARQLCATAIRYGRWADACRLVIHDAPSESGDWLQRIEAAKRHQTGRLTVAPGWTVGSTAEAVQGMRAVLARDGEGLMLRQPGHRYTPGRGFRLLKLKPDPDGIGHGLH